MPQSVVERAVAIIGNLSVDERGFVALREAGVMQRLVHLLEESPQSRIPEIAAKTLANLAANDSNQTAIRLAGGLSDAFAASSEMLCIRAAYSWRCLQVAYRRSCACRLWVPMTRSAPCNCLLSKPQPMGPSTQRLLCRTLQILLLSQRLSR